MKNLIYKVIPTDTFKISRGCGGCGCKQNFVSRKTFRVNANGNKLDVMKTPRPLDCYPYR